MKRVVRLLASVAMVNLVAGLTFTSAAQADPSPPAPVDKQYVTTESREVKCVVTAGSVLCTGNFAKQPVGCDETQFCRPDDSERPYHTVSVEAETEGLQWNDPDVQANGPTEQVLTYDRVLHLQGWTVEPSSAGTRFTNDQTGRGMFVSRQGVDYNPATPIGQSTSPCSSATAEILKSATLRMWGYSRDPFTVTKVLCSADWAKTLIDMRHLPDTNPPGIVLFHHDDDGWRAVNYGSGFDCTNDGVPHRSPPTSSASPGGDSIRRLAGPGWSRNGTRRQVAGSSITCPISRRLPAAKP